MKINLLHDAIKVDMFCIIRCPKCENIQGSRYPIKRSICIRCGTSIDIDKIVGMKLFDSHKDMLIMIQAIKMDNNDKESIITTLPGHCDHRRKTENRSKIRDLILRSTTEIISIKDLLEMMERSGIERSIVELELNNLVSSGDIFKPKEGFIKKVEP